MQRLKTRSQFQAVLSGDRVATTAHFALHRCVVGRGSVFAHPAARATLSAGQAVPILDVWLGAMVPKRWAKRAVTRNAIRRQIYSVGSLFEVDLGVAAHVVRLRSGIDRRSFHSCSSDRLKAVIRDELNMLFAAALPHAKSTPSMPTSR